MENNETVLVEPGTETVVETPSAPEQKYVELSSLQINEECMARIKYKPVTSLYVGLFFSILFIALMNLATVILGLFILGYTCFVHFVVKDAPAMEIYSTFTLIYKLDSDHLVRVIKYEDVEEWACADNEGRSSCVKFNLTNGEVVYKDTFQSSKVYRLFNKLMREKESRLVQHRKREEKNKKMKSKFRFKLPFKWPIKKK